jgi:CRP/FNR family transcriptional regulator
MKRHDPRLARSKNKGGLSDVPHRILGFQPVCGIRIPSPRRQPAFAASASAAIVSGPEPTWRSVFPALASAEGESQRVLDTAESISVPDDQVTFHVGSACAHYVLLLKGMVRVQLIGDSGREALLYRVRPGQSCVLTTCCILSGDDYPAEGITEGAVRALVIAKPAFDRALESAPAFRRFVFANLGARIAEIIVRMEEVAFRPVDRRLAAYLLAQASGAVLPITHQELAVELGTVREVVSRHLKRFETTGLVRLGRATVTVIDPEGLQRLIDAPV